MQFTAEPTGSRRRVRILVVEDHLDSREALRALLEAFGYAVLVAANGQEAVEAAQLARPDVILMDMMMPVMDGFEAIRELRRRSPTSCTPIIALTAMEGAQELALHAGADEFVRKPTDIRTLLAKVSGLLQRRIDA
jgi:CheY-like chemotaxis protein